MKDANEKMIRDNLKNVKKMMMDGRLLVAMLETLLTRAKKIQKESKKKNVNRLRLHDLKIQSQLLHIIIDDMLQAIIKEQILQGIEQRKRKARFMKNTNAKVGRK